LFNDVLDEAIFLYSNFCSIADRGWGSFLVVPSDTSHLLSRIFVLYQNGLHSVGIRILKIPRLSIIYELDLE
jgi:hypothetical protein